MLYQGLALAKYNLYLHVGNLDNNGLHPLRSLVAFADFGDTITIKKALICNDLTSVAVVYSGAYAQFLPNVSDNLISKVAYALADYCKLSLKVEIEVEKNLPIAAGIGGGSSDAGTTLLLLNEALGLYLSQDVLLSIASGLGSDGAMCLFQKSVFAKSYGEQITPIKLPKMAFVTINPNIACLTSRVFEQFDKMPISTPIMGDLNQDEVMGFKAHELISALGNTRNDLEDAAISIVPEIGGIRDLMRAQSCVKIARLTGSGATYFGLTDTLDDAKNVANILIERWPKAWVKAGYLG